MKAMFCGAMVFNQPLNHWDVSAVRNMSGMFA
jgi:surface protein